jgi:predicted nucleic acid-binding protein
VSPAKPTYVLDSFALIAYLGDEPGRTHVEDILSRAEKGECRAALCTINLGEVLYMTERRRGLVKAQQALALVQSLPLDLLDANRDLVLDAAHIKAQYALSYADAFVVAACLHEGGVILTGDPEFKEVESLVQVEWLEEDVTTSRRPTTSPNKISAS